MTYMRGIGPIMGGGHHFSPKPYKEGEEVLRGKECTMRKTASKARESRTVRTTYAESKHDGAQWESRVGVVPLYRSATD